MTTHEDSLAPDGPVAGTDLEISALLNDRIISAAPTVSIRQAAAVMDNEAIGLLVLEDGDGMSGVLSERDIVRAVATGVDLEAPASSIGSDNTIQRAAPTATVSDVAREMMENYIRHVLVTDQDGAVAGIVSVRDLLAVIVE